VIYIGKALNIKSRFKGHFSAGSKSNLSMKSEIYDVTYELTGSDFLALLLETLEIKRLWPKFNRAQKVKSNLWGIYQYEDAAGYQRFQIAKSQNLHPAVFSFTTHAEAWAYLLDKIKEYHLCPRLCGIQKSNGVCYSYPEKNCKGACCGEESVSNYNGKINRWIQSLNQHTSKILIKEKGRIQEEQAAILFDHGLLSAYGFIDNNLDYGGTEEVISVLKKVKSVPETNFILKAYLANSQANFIKL
jgi:DNA polymerase-3 subunit epsilon